MKFVNKILGIWLLLALVACNGSSTISTPNSNVENQTSATAAATEVAEVQPETAMRPPEIVAETVAPSLETPIAPVETETVIPTEMPPTPTAVANEITFIKTFGGSRRDRGINLLQTRDGDYVIVGYTSSFDSQKEDVYLVRMDPQGEMLWSQIYGGAGNDNGWAVMETEDGGFMIVGFTDSFGAGEMDIYLIRTDADGNSLWEKTFGGPQSEVGWAMAPTTDGGYVLAGQTESFGEGDKDGYLVKVTAEGEEMWSQTFGGTGEDRLFSIDQSGDGGFVLTGTTKSFGEGRRDVYLVKTDGAGEEVWAQIFGEERDDVGHAVRLTSDGGYIVTGYTQSFGAQNYDMWLLKTDDAGISQWQTFYGGVADDRAINGQQTEDGGYIVIGYTQSFNVVSWDLLLVRTDASGEVLWHKTFGGRAEDTGYTVGQTADGGFILTGETYSVGEGGGDMYVIKVNRVGEVIE